jgi:hypothetical protein
MSAVDNLISTAKVEAFNDLLASRAQQHFLGRTGVQGRAVPDLQNSLARLAAGTLLCFIISEILRVLPWTPPNITDQLF